MKTLKDNAATIDKKQEGQKTMKLQLLLSELKEVNKELKKTWINERKLPAFNNLKIEVANGETTFTVVSLALNTSYTIETPDAADGAATLPYIEFDKLVRKMKGSYITIETFNSDTQVSLSTERNKFMFDNVINNYPELPELETEDLLTVDFQTLKGILQQPLKVVSKHESRPILTGVNFKQENNTLSVVATDSHRLARNKMKLLEDNEIEFTLPGVELEKMLKLNFNDHVVITISKEYVTFNDSTRNVVIRKLEGNYPRTDHLIPQDFNATFKLDRKGLLNDLELSKILIDKSNNSIINMKVENNNIILSNLLAGVENKLAMIDYTGYKKEDVEINFNPDYLIETLKQLSSNEVEIKFVSILRPFIVNDPTNETLDNLITPIRRGA